MKFFTKTLLALTLGLACSTGAKAVGWPANFEGVMLQGFYWESYNDSKWTNLTAQADELSQSFKLIWIPNCSRAASYPGMGYDAVYWMKNHNSSFGTAAELKTMIATFKEKGTGFIAETILNHRSGVSNWYNFPTESYDGKTFELGLDCICSNDEMANAAGQPKPTGNRDTGENFDGSRDLDHTNPKVQEACKYFCKYLLNELGFVGFRLDMTKGYSGQYTKMYNQFAKPTYSVAEYWDGSYDALAAWIESTGRESAVFDFAFKYAVNNAFNANDMSQLTWLAGSAPQPAGMIHYGYQQLAVTFIDNHDTYHENNHNTFKGDIPAANAFMICSPGTPCVFLKHWMQYKSEIKKMIAARNGVGVTNTSKVNVLQASRDCYMAEVTGTRGKLVVRIGSSGATPQGYSDSQIAAKGSKYCIWTTNQGGNPNNDPIPTPSGDPFNIYFDNSSSNWSTPYVHYWGNTESTWPGVTMTKHDGNVWVYQVPAGTTGLVFNDGNGSQTGDFVAVENHIYNTSGDQGVYNGATPPTPPTPGNGCYAYLKNTSGWDTPYVWAWNEGGNCTSAAAWPGDPMTQEGSVWKWTAPSGANPTMIIFNNGNGVQTADLVFQNGATYDCDGNIVSTGNNDPNPNPNPNPDPTPGEYPEHLYLVGNINGQNWDISICPEADSASNGVYVWNKIHVENLPDADLAPSGYGYFSFITATGVDWDEDVNPFDRYGATEPDAILSSSAPIEIFRAGINASSAYAWKVPAGDYRVTADLSKMIVTLSDPSGVESVMVDNDAPAAYYNLQGVRVAEAANGLYIVVRGGKTSKVLVK